jgi:hypothetical protein
MKTAVIDVVIDGNVRFPLANRSFGKLRVF